jgi:hypothetical protein
VLLERREPRQQHAPRFSLVPRQGNGDAHGWQPPNAVSTSWNAR